MYAGEGRREGGGIALVPLVDEFCQPIGSAFASSVREVGDNLGSTWQLHLSESGMGSLEIMMQPPPAAKQVSKLRPCVRLRMCVHACACACACLPASVWPQRDWYQVYELHELHALHAIWQR